MKSEEQKSYTLYITGFLLSVALTLGAYGLVQGYLHAQHRISAAHTLLLVGLALLAIVQCAIQLVFFLHLGSEAKPRWRLRVFLLMATVVGIIVIGSLWIMHNLNYTMTEKQINTYMQSQDGL